MKTIGPHTPIQYIAGKAKFCGIDFSVDERVLIPRPETELLVRVALHRIYSLQTARLQAIDTRAGGLNAYSLKLLDLCTGSGCIAVAMSRLLAMGGVSCKIIASDVSEEALAIAETNASKAGVAGTIEFINSDLFDKLEGKFDIILSNPPYIARHEFDTLQAEVLKEPRLALDGGEDGLDFYRKIISGSPRHLSPDGYLIMEMGFGQSRAIRDILNRYGFEFLGVEKDFNGIDRIIVAKRTD